MIKRILLTLLVLIGSLLHISCDENGGRLNSLTSTVEKIDARMEEIILAIKNKDKEALKSLFSTKALDEASAFDSELDSLFDFIQGNIESWERDNWATDEDRDYGKKTLMIRFPFTITTDEDVYELFVIDYNTDTINPNNQGIYMLEVSKLSYEGTYLGWQDRMRAGICILT